ncbi:MAG: hypothetical protein HC838_04930 [Spirulinaceae cyanobacterium RM2_2_10]|nr:hypothetical protein [Spirulinaceae cyanobacterium RM2_2_10]
MPKQAFTFRRVNIDLALGEGIGVEAIDVVGAGEIALEFFINARRQLAAELRGDVANRFLPIVNGKIADRADCQTCLNRKCSC